MKNILVEYMSHFLQLTSEEEKGIEESFPIKKIIKNTFLLKEGQIAKDAYLIVEGCVRKYKLENGEEITSDFYTEEQTCADFNSLANQHPSNYNYECTEETIVAVINAEKEALLYKKFPRFESVCRVEFEKMMGLQVQKLQEFMTKSPEEKYLDLLEKRPNLLTRVPQYQIASYLGIKPETLSRIRKRISKN